MNEFSQRELELLRYAVYCHFMNSPIFNCEEYKKLYTKLNELSKLDTVLSELIENAVDLGEYQFGVD